MSDSLTLTSAAPVQEIAHQYAGGFVSAAARAGAPGPAQTKRVPLKARAAARKAGQSSIALDRITTPGQVPSASAFQSAL
jgi:hypothetical protein